MNESTILLLTYVYMFFKQSYEANLFMGLVFIVIFISNVLINFLFVVLDFIFDTIPKVYTTVKQKIDKWKYQWKIKRWFNEKNSLYGKDRLGDIDHVYYVEAVKIYRESQRKKKYLWQK